MATPVLTSLVSRDSTYLPGHHQYLDYDKGDQFEAESSITDGPDAGGKPVGRSECEHRESARYSPASWMLQETFRALSNPKGLESSRLLTWQS